MRKTINNVKIEGKVYDHSLKTGVSKTGKNYVMGELQIQVSDTNTVPVRFIEMETSSLGNENKKYRDRIFMFGYLFRERLLHKTNIMDIEYKPI